MYRSSSTEVGGNFHLGSPSVEAHGGYTVLQGFKTPRLRGSEGDPPQKPPRSPTSTWKSVPPENRSGRRGTLGSLSGRSDPLTRFRPVRVRFPTRRPTGRSRPTPDPWSGPDRGCWTGYRRETHLSGDRTDTEVGVHPRIDKERPESTRGVRSEVG